MSASSRLIGVVDDLGHEDQRAPERVAEASEEVSEYFDSRDLKLWRLTFVGKGERLAADLRCAAWAPPGVL